MNIEGNNGIPPHSTIQSEPAGTDRRTPKAKGPKRTGLVILLVLCSLALAMTVLGLGSSPIPSVTLSVGDFKEMPRILSESSSSWGASYIAVLHIEGVIQQLNETYDQAWLISTIRDLAQDRRNKAILLYIDSPGGGVYQSDEVYLELLDYKESSGKPVWAYLGPLAASGGYYIACAADYIVANRNTLTGSIGVISGQSVDISQFLEEHGIKVNTFYSGRNKNMLGLSVPVTQEQRDIMQSLSDECYHQFVDIVATSRGMSKENATALADGRIYSAWQALDQGLIDEVVPFDDAVISLQVALDDLSLKETHYSPKEFSFMNHFFSSLTSAVSRIMRAASPMEHLLLEAKERAAPDISYPAYYYPH